MTTPGGADLTDGQRLAAEQLAEIADSSEGAVEVLGPARSSGDGPAVILEVSLDCTAMACTEGGIRMRPRERFELEVAPDFPFSLPEVRVAHDRWADESHVQWGHVVCLYAAPSVEWVPADGMRGLLDRLILWLRQAAVGDLDPEGLPLHPPVAYVSSSASVVVCPDLSRDREPPSTAAGAQFLVAVCTQRYTDRVEVTDWAEPAQWQQRFRLAELNGNFDDHGRRPLGAAVVLLDADIGFEYPDTPGALLAGLAWAGADRSAVLGLLSSVAEINTHLDNAHAIQGVDVAPRPLHLFVGTPSRRPASDTRRFTHLVCWRIDDLGQRLLAEAGRSSASHPVEHDVAGWLDQTRTRWVQVLEKRPHVTRRRDQGSSATWLTGKRVLILGCGAIGAPAAEICVRADAAEVTVADSGIVTPGIVVRQPYTDDDIGCLKALVLAKRLNQIHDDDRVQGLPGNVLVTLLNDRLPIDLYDLIIDATANTSVASRLEWCHATIPGDWPAVFTLMIGHDARRGVVAVSRTSATGVGRDILRRLAIAACGPRQGQLADIADDFYPNLVRTQMFQPEPGCSEPTFVGSSAEAFALAAHLMTAGLDELAGHTSTGGRPMAVVASA